MLTAMLVFCYVSKMISMWRAKMVRNDQQVNVRMPHELVDELKIQAIKHRRSMTAQLNAIVEEWIKNQKESAKA